MNAKQKRFNDGVAYANTPEGKENAPGVSEGLDFWRGWQSTPSGQWRTCKELGHNFSFQTDSQDVAAALEYCPLKPNQYRYWTSFNTREDVTGVMVDAYEGDIVALWVTDSSSPWSIHALWEPLPVSYW